MKAVAWTSAVAALFLSGCTFISRGATFDVTKARTFHTETTKADVLGAIGSPLLATREGEKETWAYFYGTSRLVGISVLIATFASENSKSQYLTLVFTGEKLTGISFQTFLGLPGNVTPPVYNGVPLETPQAPRASPPAKAS